jgi:NTE family protein
MRTIGVVLSGGGARGIAHLGVLEALRESGLQIDAIAGTSSGAIAGVLYAAGNKPRQILGILKENSYFGVSRLLFQKEGIFKMAGLKKMLQQHVFADHFEDLPVKLFVAATDLSLRRSVIFDSGPLLEPVMASACVPVIFEPVHFQDTEWVDGGILNNFPVEPLEKTCDIIIGSHVNKLGDEPPGNMTLHKMHILERCFHMAIAEGVYEKSSRCDLFLDPPELAQYDLFNIRQADEIFEIGYRHCMKHGKELAALFSDMNQ